MDGKGLCGILRKLPLPDAGGRTSSVKTWVLLCTDAKLDIYIYTTRLVIHPFIHDLLIACILIGTGFYAYKVRIFPSI
jgi:hypothetical protein